MYSDGELPVARGVGVAARLGADIALPQVEPAGHASPEAPVRRAGDESRLKQRLVVRPDPGFLLQAQTGLDRLANEALVSRHEIEGTLRSGEDSDGAAIEGPLGTEHGRRGEDEAAGLEVAPGGQWEGLRPRAAADREQHRRPLPLLRDLGALCREGRGSGFGAIEHQEVEFVRLG